MFVDNETGDLLGFRRDSSTRDELIVQAFADPSITTDSFTLYEDDGESNDYKTTGKRTTVLTNNYVSSTSHKITIGASSGWSVSGNRRYDTELISENKKATAVSIKIGSASSSSLTDRTNKASYDSNTEGFYYDSIDRITYAKVDNKAQNKDKLFTFTMTSISATTSVSFVVSNANTAMGQAIFIVGSDSALGNWDRCNSIRAEYRNSDNSGTWHVVIIYKLHYLLESP